MKKIIILSSLILLTVGIFAIYYFNDHKKEAKIIDNPIKEVKEEKVNENDKSINEVINDDINDDDSVVSSTAKSDKKVDNHDESNVVNSQNKTEDVQVKINKPKEEPKQEEIQVQDTPVITQPKEQTPWEKLGLTEDQYKNKPIYAWEEVEYSTREECAAYGDTHPPYSTGEGSYDCNEVSSWTRSLGWDFVPHYR